MSAGRSPHSAPETQRKPATSVTNKTTTISASAMAGAIELALFHPVDTISKRIQNEKGKFVSREKSFSSTYQFLKQVIFKEASQQPLGKKVTSLYNGFVFAGVYKITQRAYKFGGQPIVKEGLESHFGEEFKRHFSDKQAKILLEATAGAMIGAGEILLLPFDNLKIKYQNNKTYFKQWGAWQIVRNENLNLYNGSSITVMRNVPGSFILFGVNAVVKEYVLHLENHRHATFSQNLVAASAGAVASIIATNPFDLPKTRVQSVSGSVNAFSVFKEVVKKEGVLALFKGTTPKVIAAAPKVTLAMTLAQTLSQWGEKKLNRHAEKTEEAQNNASSHNRR